MGLFAPWFLLGTLAVGLPIYLHLLKRAKNDPKPFPSLMFFEHRETSSVQHRRLDYILLFILRTLLILLLVALFAHPFIRRLTPAASGDRIVVVALDRSLSMRTTEGAQTRLDLAKAEANSILAGLPARTKAQVVALAGNLQAMTQQIEDQGELRAAVAAIDPSDSRASYGELSRYLRSLRESADVPIEAHLIGDLQKSALPPGFLDLRLESDTNLILHPIGETKPNWAVETVNSPQRIYDPKEVHVAVTIAGFNAPAATRTVTLMLNGKTVNQKSVEIPEGGRGTVEFVGLEASYGFNRAEVRIDSADSLVADDRYIFSVERTDPRKVMFVDEGVRPQSQNFFRTALESSPENEFAMDVVRPEVAANSDLSKYAMVVLSDMGQGSARAIEKKMTDYVEGGGGVLQILGPNSVQLATAPVIGESIEGSNFAARKNELFFSVGELEATHPALQSVERFDNVKFHQATTVRPQNSQVLAKLGDGTPLVLERKRGQGTVVAFTSNLDGVSNDFPLKPSYVGFVQQAVRYLAGGGADQPVNLPVDSYVELRTGKQQGVSSEVTGPDGQRLLSLEDAANAPNFALSQEGFYDVKNAAGRRFLAAAHADRRESDLSTIPEETLSLWKATGEPGQTATAGATGTSAEGSTTPWSLAPILLVLLLLLAVAESVAANRYLRAPGSHQEMTKA